MILLHKYKNMLSALITILYSWNRTMANQPRNIILLSIPRGKNCKPTLTWTKKIKRIKITKNEDNDDDDDYDYDDEYNDDEMILGGSNAITNGKLIS